MAIPVNSLGVFNFISFHQPGSPASPPPTTQMDTEITTRPGVDGSGLFLLGIKGSPFVMRSVVDVATRQAGHVVLSAYHAAVGSRLPLIWADINYTAVHRVFFDVTKVEAPKLKMAFNMTGGLSGAVNGFLVEILWHLMPVPSQ